MRQSRSGKSQIVFDATYKALLDIILELNKGDVAIEVAKYIANNVK